MIRGFLSYATQSSAGGRLAQCYLRKVCQAGLCQDLQRNYGMFASISGRHMQMPLTDDVCITVSLIQ